LVHVPAGDDHRVRLRYSSAQPPAGAAVVPGTRVDAHAPSMTQRLVGWPAGPWSLACRRWDTRGTTAQAVEPGKAGATTALSRNREPACRRAVAPAQASTLDPSRTAGSESHGWCVGGPVATHSGR